MKWKKISTSGSSSSSNTNNKNDTNDLCFLISWRKIPNIGCSFEVQCSHTYGNNLIDNFNFSNCIKCFGNQPNQKQSRKNTRKTEIGRRRGREEVSMKSIYIIFVFLNWRRNSALVRYFAKYAAGLVSLIFMLATTLAVSPSQMFDVIEANFVTTTRNQR